MKEIGSSEAKRAFVLCTDINCSLNIPEYKSMPVEQAIAFAIDHEVPGGSETVLVRDETGHRLTREQKLEIFSLTGVAIF